MNLILVLAGNKHQFDDYTMLMVPRVNHRKFVYYTGVNSIKGARFSEVRLIGTWWANPTICRDQSISELFTILSVASGFDWSVPIDNVERMDEIEIECNL